MDLEDYIKQMRVIIQLETVLISSDSKTPNIKVSKQRCHLF